MSELHSTRVYTPWRNLEMRKKVREIVLILKYLENLRGKVHNFSQNMEKLFSYFGKKIKSIFKLQVRDSGHCYLPCFIADYCYIQNIHFEKLLGNFYNYFCENQYEPYLAKAESCLEVILKTISYYHLQFSIYHPKNSLKYISKVANPNVIPSLYIIVKILKNVDYLKWTPQKEPNINFFLGS